MRALIDTGASRSVISENFFHDLRLKYEIGAGIPRNLIVADGRLVPVKGKVGITIKVNGLNMPFEFLILKNSQHAIILGTDFLEYHKAKIDFEEKVITFYDGLTATHLKGTKDKMKLKQLIYTIDDFELQPNGEAILPITIASDFIGKTSIIEPISSLDNQKFLVAKSIQQPSSNQAACKVLNLTNKAIKISHDKPIAYVEELFEDELLTLDGTDNDDLFEETENDKYKRESQAKIDSNKTVTELGIKLSDNELTEEQKQRLAELIIENKKLFAKSLKDLPGTTLVHHRIDTGDNPPQRTRCYRYPPRAKQEIDKQIDDMLEAGIIEPSESMWGAPIVLVKKKSGEFRMCVDFRKLNSVTKQINFPLPDLQDVVDAMSEAHPKYFSVLDLKSGFYQIPLSPDTKEKTTFVSHSGQYNFLRLPMGMTNAPISFQILMTKVLKGQNFKNLLCYVDDVIIFSKSFEEHLKHLKEVFYRLDNADLRLHPEKCKFAMPKVLYLGHFISEKGVEVDSSKIEIITKYPQPTSQKQIRQFLGLCGYYRKFIRNYAAIANPLNRLLRKEMEFIFDKECEKSFQTLKEALASTPVLAFPDLNKPFIINTDASTVGIGFILSQANEQGVIHPICYGGRSLTRAERHYSATELECLALVSAVKQFHCYLVNTSFTIETDHVSLKWLQSLKSSTSGRLLRWSILLQGYNYTVKYKAGYKNTNADALSRCFNEVNESQVSDEFLKIGEVIEDSPEVNTILESELIDQDPNDTLWNDITEAQRSCPDLEPMIRYLESEEIPESNQEARKLIIEANEYVLQNGALYHLWQPRAKKSARRFIQQLVIPRKMRKQILEGVHDQMSHPGFNRCYLSLRMKYFWKGQFADVEKHIKSCEECQRCKYPSNQAKPPLKSFQVDPIMYRWHMDIVIMPESREGYKYILVVIESLSRWVEFIPLKDQTATTVATALYREIITRYGSPRVLVTDRAQNFRSQIVDALSKLFGIKRVMTSSFNPTGNSPAERTNRSIWNLLRILSKEEKDWPDYLPAVAMQLRGITNAHLGYSPFYILFGLEMRFPTDLQMPEVNTKTTPDSYIEQLIPKLKAAREAVKEATEEMQADNKRLHDVKAKPVDYKVGQLVLMFNPVVPVGKKTKLNRRYIGPFLITKIIPPNTYRLRNPITNKDLLHPVNAKRIKPYFDRRDFINKPQPEEEEEKRLSDDEVTRRKEQTESPKTQAKPELTLDKGEWFPAEKLLKMKIAGTKRYYLVLWKDKSYKPTWIIADDVSEYLKRIFHIDHTLQGRKRKKIKGVK